MSSEQILFGCLGVIVACAVLATRGLLAYFGRFKLVDKFDHYFPYAVMAAKWVERNVPDDFGAGADDPKLKNAAHKLDLFLKKCIELVETQTGEKPSETLKREAMKWSVALAERLGGGK